MNDFGNLMILAFIMLGVLFTLELGKVCMAMAFESTGFFMPGIYLSIGVVSFGLSFYGSFYVVKSCYFLLMT